MGQSVVSEYKNCLNYYKESKIKSVLELRGVGFCI